MYAGCQVRIEPKHIIMVFAALMLLESLVNHNPNILLSALEYFETIVIHKISDFKVVIIYKIPDIVSFVAHAYNYSSDSISAIFCLSRRRVSSSVFSIKSTMTSVVASMTVRPLESQYGHVFHRCGLWGSWWPWLNIRVPLHMLHVIFMYSLSKGTL